MVRILTFLLAALAWAPAAAAAEGPIDTLNAWRSEAGVAPLAAMDPTASEGCRLHDVYLANSDEFGHAEDPASPFYTPLGAATGPASLLAEGPDALEMWLLVPYHRIALLEPRLRVTGYAAVGDFTCLKVLDGNDDSARTSSLTLYPWPPARSRDVPTAGPEPGLEIPDPYDKLPGVIRAGYMLTVNFNGPWAYTEGSTVDLSRVSLTSARGAVAITGLDLGGGFGLFPHRPLSRARWYTARAAGVVHNSGRDYPFDFSWRFETLRYDPALRVDASSSGVAVASRSPAPVRLRLRRAGALIYDGMLDPGERAPVEPGTYAACATQRGDERYQDARRCLTLAAE